MSETKIFRKKDLDLEPVNGMKTMRGETFRDLGSGFVLVQHKIKENL